MRHFLAAAALAIAVPATAEEAILHDFDGDFEDAVHVLGTASRLPAVTKNPGGLGRGVD